MSILNKKKPGLPYLSILKTDMHSHLIPGIDDGSGSTDESLNLIYTLHKLGFSKLIITPHIQGDFFKNTPGIILTGLDALRQAVEKEKIPITLEAAAEYLIDDKFMEKYKSGRLLTFNDNFLLVELSFFSPPPNLYEIIFDLQIDGYKIILAHPERYSYWHNNFDRYKDLIDRGVYLQINIPSLGGYYQNYGVIKTAKKLIDNNMVSFLGTDTHNINYLNSIEKALNEKYLKKILKSKKLLNSSL
ncbi:MAG: hypothetical protein J7J86_05180 [Bacteroidales bacterium]|nr:hypothetical protein [Bacteroidales bacterium]